MTLIAVPYCGKLLMCSWGSARWCTHSYTDYYWMLILCSSQIVNEHRPADWWVFYDY